jgi:hypothetical protein
MTVLRALARYWHAAPEHLIAHIDRATAALENWNRRHR